MGSRDIPKGQFEDFPFNSAFYSLLRHWLEVLVSSIISYWMKVSLGKRVYSKMSDPFQNPEIISHRLLLSEYDLVSPYEVDRNGDYVSHDVAHPQRRRRALAQLSADPDSLYLRLRGFRHDFHMQLRVSSLLVAPGFVVQTLGKGGAKSVQAFPPEDFCFYQGSLESHKNSSVALSTCKGLVSIAPAACKEVTGTGR